MNKEFEQLPDVAEKYTTANSSFYDSVNWLNGAWYAFQEQQKKIDAMLDHTCGSFEDFK